MTASPFRLRKRGDETMHKLAEICVRRPVFATMLIMALVVMGIFSFSTLGLDLLPKVDLPTVVVTVSDPGASAEDIETDITKRIEDAVNTTSDIDTLTLHQRQGFPQWSCSSRSARMVTLARRKFRDKVSQVTPQLPEIAKAPVVQKLDPDALPILQMVVSSPRPLREVTEIADKQIRPRLENIAGVGEIRIVGGLKREIRVWVDPQRMRAYNLTVS